MPVFGTGYFRQVCTMESPLTAFRTYSSFLCVCQVVDGKSYTISVSVGSRITETLRILCRNHVFVLGPVLTVIL